MKRELRFARLAGGILQPEKVKRDLESVRLALVERGWLFLAPQGAFWRCRMAMESADGKELNRKYGASKRAER
jgi:hypothetical protein